MLVGDGIAIEFRREVFEGLGFLCGERCLVDPRQGRETRVDESEDP